MRTDDLIAALAADTASRRPDLDRSWLLALAAGGLLAVLVFLGAVGPRADLAQAIQTPRFDFKFVLTLSLAVPAFFALRALAIPGAKVPLAALALAPALGIMAVIAELIVLPADVWAMSAVGKNARYCLTFIPLIGVAPLAAFIAVLRHGAPTRPALAGAVAGLLAGGIAATLYAIHCTDDSPLFVMTWYPLAIAILILAGAALGRIFARW
ncbi:NrsF family protein [Pelagibacterium limicola]|uniref:NrsF family protein n=1 Tax=Pelagibacterium limicola TaxID=2791022 RepID=UPI0018AFA5EF|nr:NrsF family protein [Pelagibacterium limicola]